MLYMNVEQLAKRAGVTKNRVYYIRRQLALPKGVLPSVEEIKNYTSKRKRGRPNEYSKEGE